MVAQPESKLQRTKRRSAQMKLVRTRHETKWQEIEGVMLPTRGQFLTNDVEAGEREDEEILDCTATLSLRALSSGFLGGYTSPSRPWFSFTVANDLLMEQDVVKSWCYRQQTRMQARFQKSNLYNALAELYEDAAAFGTSAMLIEEDLLEVFRFYVLPIGSYWIGQNERQVVDCLYREFRMTVRQLIEKFGREYEGGPIDWSKFSEYVKGQWDEGNYETWIDVAHMIQPNEEYAARSKFAKRKRFSSCYFELGSAGNNTYQTSGDDRYLRESGYDYFPAVCARWNRTHGQVYATNCPGMTALGDVNALQVMVRRALQAIEKMVNPATNAPLSLKSQGATIVSGETNWTTDGKGVTPVHEVDPKIAELQAYIEETRQRIRSVFFEDVILMLTRSDLRNMTATEIEARNDEKMLSFGPVLQQLNDGVIEPLIDVCWAIMSERGEIEPPPEEIAGMDLKVEYVSMMAQAQKLVEAGPLERFMNFAALIVKDNPSAAMKIDFDQLLDVYAKLVTLQPGIVRDDEDVAKMRAAQAEAQAQQMQQEAIQGGAAAAKDLGATPMDTDNALTRLIKTVEAGMPRARRAA